MIVSAWYNYFQSSDEVHDLTFVYELLFLNSIIIVSLFCKTEIILSF